MENKIEIYKTADGKAGIAVNFKEDEPEEKSVVANIATTAANGKTYHVDFYNLNMIISVGYRVNSKQGTQFRVWATKRIKDYLIIITWR